MRTLFIIGSPKTGASASRTLADELAERLCARGGEAVFAHALRASRSEAATEELHAEVAAADLVVLSFPLYVDSLPAPLTRVLELLAERGGLAGKPLAVLVQCGFPEAWQCDTAVAICRRFADRTGMRWGGALQMGMGGSVGEGLDKVPPGGAARVRESLEGAAVGLSRGEAVPAEARDVFARPLMPAWLYIAGGNLGWRLQMRKHRARAPIAFRPYPQSPADQLVQ